MPDGTQDAVRRMERSPIVVILASGSPRRRELLAQAGVPFEVVAPTIEELDETTGHLPPTQQAEALAYFKARYVWDKDPARWVLGADTMVALGATILGKPADRDDARRMLSSLSGTRHAVITGVALIGPEGRWIASDHTFVTMRTLSPQEIEDYLASGQWAGKAGAYGIQETPALRSATQSRVGDRFVERVEGSWSNVMGLPMELVGRMLARIPVPTGGRR